MDKKLRHLWPTRRGPASMTRALITGVTSQDGAYLAALLLGKGHEVFGLAHRHGSAEAVAERLRLLGCAGTVHLVDGNPIDLSSLIRVLQEVQPDEIYNLAAQSFVRMSWNQPLLTTQVTAIGHSALKQTPRRPDGKCTRLLIPRDLVLEKGR